MESQISQLLIHPYWLVSPGIVLSSVLIVRRPQFTGDDYDETEGRTFQICTFSDPTPRDSD